MILNTNYKVNETCFQCYLAGVQDISLNPSLDVFIFNVPFVKIIIKAIFKTTE